MLLFARIEISSASTNPVEVALQAKRDGADWLHVVDLDAAVAGAPQNIQWVHQILGECDLPLQFRGGVNLVHTAEMVLGLGARRVVLDSALTKTERSPAHFFSRLGEACVAAISDSGPAQSLIDEGCRRLLYEGSGPAPETAVPILAGSERNLEHEDGVSFEGVVVAPSRLRSFGKECSKP